MRRPSLSNQDPFRCNSVAYHWGETRRFVDNVGHEAGAVRAELVTSAKYGTDRIVAIDDDHFTTAEARKYAEAIIAACEVVEQV